MSQNVVDFQLFQESVYEKCGLNLTNLIWSSESVEYGACRFELGGMKIIIEFLKLRPQRLGNLLPFGNEMKRA
ncbi:MAG: hypothetical protein ACRCVT_02245 [Leadbetterella sp.]